MARCSYCGNKTELHEAGVPTCTICADRLRDSAPKKVRSVHSQSIQELLQATADHDSATAAHKRVMWEIPSAIPHPDGVQRIRSVSYELSVAKERLARTHTRLTDFLDRGIIPEDLGKRLGYRLVLMPPTLWGALHRC